MPEGPASAVAWSTAAETIGSDQSAARNVSAYIFAMAGGGALSLPIRKPITEGWLRSRRASLAMDSSATFVSAAVQGAPPVLAADSHLSQHSQPASTMMPLRSARS